MKQSAQYGDQINTMFKQINEKDDKIAALVEKVKIVSNKPAFLVDPFLTFRQHNDCLLRLNVLGGTIGVIK